MPSRERPPPPAPTTTWWWWTTTSGLGPSAGPELSRAGRRTLTTGGKMEQLTRHLNVWPPPLGSSSPLRRAGTRSVLTPGTILFCLIHGSRVPPHLYLRFQNSGNSVDMCIRKGSTRIACYGNAIQNDWRTTGVCTIQTLATTDTISLYLESGGSSDCVQVTEYQKFFTPRKYFYIIRKQAGVTTAYPSTWSCNLHDLRASASRMHQV